MVGATEEISDLGRTRDPPLNKRGVFMLGNAWEFVLGVSIIVEGAALGRAWGEGEGGKTNNVCEGVMRGREGTRGLGGAWRGGGNAGIEV